MARPVCVAVFVCVLGGMLVAAQQAREDPARDLPIRRVVLYKSGIGFFEHVGRVTGTARLTIPFTGPQLDDVLKTLTVLDLDGGQVSSVGYSADAPLGRRLSATGLPLESATTLTEFIGAMRGARVEVRRGTVTAAGRLLDVQQRSRERAGSVETVDQVSLVSDVGELHTFELGAGTTLRFADPGMNQRLNRALEAIASARDQSRRTLAIDAAGTGTRRLYVSYVSEVPVWKTTYRIVLPDDPKDTPRLQGWAIVDNTVGDDWNDVELSLVAGAPQSFVQPISQPLYTRRPEVPLSGGLLVRPQSHAATLAQGTQVSGTVVDSSGAVLPGALVRVFNEQGTQLGAATTGADGRFSVPANPGRVRLDASLSGFKPITVLSETGAETRLVMSIGELAESISTTAAAPARRSMKAEAGRGVVGGVVSGLPSPPPSPLRLGGNISAQVVAAELGELFEYKLEGRVSIPQNRSAMVPIVSAPVTAERVSLWNRSEAGARPRRALWLTNSSGLTLDGGSVAVIDAGVFGGEGLVETVKPGERRLISYAVDLGMQVEVRTDQPAVPRTRVLISRGVVTTETFQCQRLRYTARNQDSSARQLIVEQGRPEGWQIAADSEKPVETTVNAYRFRLAVPAGGTATLAVSTYQPLRSSSMLAAASQEELEVHLTALQLDPATRRALEPLVAARRAVADLERRYNATDNEMATIETGQTRIRENMRALKGSSEERELLARYVRQLSEQEDRLTTLRQTRDSLQQELDAKRQEFARLAEAASAEAGPLGTPCS
jgi:hypothetical protein